MDAGGTDSASGIDAVVGTRIRALRAERGLTLDGLAAVAEVSRAMLSRVERGESSPTAQLLNKICGGLGVTLSGLFATEAAAVPMVRRSEQTAWRDPASGYVRRNVSPSGTGSAVELTEIAFPPGASVAFENRRVAGTDQHVWVLEGKLEIELGDERFTLGGGDCLFMRFDRPVRFRNPTPHTVRYAVIVSHGAAPP